MNNETTFPIGAGKQEDNRNPALRPIGPIQSMLYFGIPAALAYASFHVFRPWLLAKGYDDLTSFLAASCIPVALLFAFALIAYHRFEGHPFTRPAFSRRMRFPRLALHSALAGTGLAVLCLLSYGAFSFAGKALIQAGVVTIPAGLPILADPTAVFSYDLLARSAGGQIQGRWDIALLFLVTYFFNIAGEELWWRGYIFPRQELAFGRFTWLIHGLLWTAFHAFKWWDLIGLLPICLLIAYAAQRMKNNWPALIAHALVNVTGPLLVISAVIG